MAEIVKIYKTKEYKPYNPRTKCEAEYCEVNGGVILRTFGSETRQDSNEKVSQVLHIDRQQHSN